MQREAVVYTAFVCSICIIGVACVFYFALPSFVTFSGQPMLALLSSNTRRLDSKTNRSFSPLTHWHSVITVQSRPTYTNMSLNMYVVPFRPTRKRLGNQLFAYAALLGVASRNNRIALWPDTASRIRAAFNIRMPIDWNNRILKNRNSQFIVVREVAHAIYMPETEHLPNRNVTLVDFFCSWRYFQQAEGQLREHLTFKRNIVVQAKRFILSSVPKEWLQQDFIRVVIHVRRTDLANKRIRSFGFAPPDKDYFNRSIDFFLQRFVRVQFIVLSDDIKWCRRNIRGNNVVYSQGHDYYVDMAIASLCNHAIITVGTFGWWVAWFANGITITQKNHPVPGTWLSRDMKREDFYKPNWISF